MSDLAATGFPATIRGFDIHVYFLQSYPPSVTRAQQLHQSLHQAFPALKLYPIVARPVGPHPTGMFQAVVTTAEEFGTVVPWLVVNRDGLSVLVHPHTGDAVKDHSEHATWLGEKVPVNLEMLRVMQMGE